MSEFEEQATSAPTYALTLSHVVIDEIWKPAAPSPLEVLGGAGIHAVLGQALAYQSHGTAIVVSGVGKDLPESIRRDLEGAGIDDRGLAPVVDETPRTLVRYVTDEDRTETPAFGFDHFQLCDPQPSMIPEAYWSPQAIYIFAGVTEPAWEVVGQVRSPTTVLWELDVAVCEPAFTARVRAMSVQADLISINEQELRKLVGGASSGDLRRTLDEVFPGVAAIALRRGADGAVLATRDGVWIARPDQGRSVVDPTGAGNAFSGALSVAWTLTRGDPRAALRSAMAAAAVTVVHQGVTLPMTPELRTDYAQIADSQKVESLTWQEFLQ